MIGLNLLFEEDIEMQDAVEDLDDLVDNTDDIIIGAIEDRNRQSEGDIHPSLFTDVKESVDDISDADIEELLSDDDIDAMEDYVDDEDLVDDELYESAGFMD